MPDCVLTRESNICLLSTCVQSLEGLASASASPTDIWIINFKPDTTYDGQELATAFLKISVNPNYLDTPANQGLQYELKVYARVVNELLDRRVCPHFVRGYLVSSMCGFDDLLRIAQAGLSDQVPPDAEPDFLQNFLVENIAFMITQPTYKNQSSFQKAASKAERSKSPVRESRNPESKASRSKPESRALSSKARNPSSSARKSPTRSPIRSLQRSPVKSTAVAGKSAKIVRRPAISNFDFEKRPEPPAIVRDVDAVERIERTLRYGCLLTERSPVESLSDWLAKDPKFRYEDFLAVLFQLIVTLWVLELRRMVHYDLHTGNVLIEHIRPRRLGYVLDGEEYKVNTTWLVRIFDFDRSYAVSLGCNKWHVESECQFVPNLDLARLLCDMFKDLKVSTHPHRTRMIRTLEDVFGVSQGTITPNVCSSVTADGIQKMVPNASGVPQDLLRDCLPRLAKRMEFAKGQAEEFVIDHRMFRPNGELRSEEEYELMLERRQIELPTRNEGLSDLEDRVTRLRKSVEMLGKQVEEGNLEAAKARSKALTLGVLGTAASAIAAGGVVYNWWDSAPKKSSDEK